MWGIKGLHEEESAQAISVTGLVLRLGDARTTKRNNRVRSLIVRDADASVLVVCWGESCAALADESGAGIGPGDVIQVVRPVVKLSGRPTIATSSSLELQVSKAEQLVKLAAADGLSWRADFDASVPTLSACKEHSLVEVRQCLPGRLVSTRGVVSSLGSPRHAGQAGDGDGDGQSTASRWFQRCGLVEPSSGGEFTVTFWGLSSVQLLQHGAVAVGRTVLLLHGVRVTTHQGHVGASFSDQSLAWFDPPQLRWLRDWAATAAPTAEPPLDADAPRLSIRHVGDGCRPPASLGDDAHAVVKLSCLRLDSSATYRACPTCRRKVEGAACAEPACGRAAPVDQWKLAVAFVDCTATMTAVLFGKVAEDLLGLSAADFCAAADDDDIVERTLARLLWRPCRITLRWGAAAAKIVRVVPVGLGEYVAAVTSSSEPTSN